MGKKFFIRKFGDICMFFHGTPPCCFRNCVSSHGIKLQTLSSQAWKLLGHITETPNLVSHANIFNISFTLEVFWGLFLKTNYVCRSLQDFKIRNIPWSKLLHYFLLYKTVFSAKDESEYLKNKSLITAESLEGNFLNKTFLCVEFMLNAIIC